MYSTKEIALEALKHCINLDDPFSDMSCSEGCPLWHQCSFSDLDVILSDLQEILLSLRDPSERVRSLCDGIRHVIECEDEDPTPLFRDIYSYLKEAGCYAA